MQGIDISKYQKGINLKRVPCDFVIVKASQGTAASPTFTEQYSQAKAAGKLLGVYHYVNGIGAKAEAQYFYNTVKNCIGEAILCIDWEDNQNKAKGNLDYLRELIEEVIKLTGIKPFVYCYSAQFPHSVCAEFGLQKWIARYQTKSATGYIANPCGESTTVCAIRQYSGYRSKSV